MDVITKVYMETKIIEIIAEIQEIVDFDFEVSNLLNTDKGLGGYVGQSKSLLFDYEKLAEKSEDFVYNVVCHEIGHLLSHQKFGNYIMNFKKLQDFRDEEELADKIGQAIYKSLGRKTPFYAPSKDLERVAEKDKIYTEYLERMSA